MTTDAEKSSQVKPYRLRLVGLVTGNFNFSRDQYVKSYDPNFTHLVHGYDGGILVTTSNAEDAMGFDSPAAAMEFWRTRAPEPYHLRQDGTPNRPLTAFTCEISRA